jgi:hypothetical protein
VLELFGAVTFILTTFGETWVEDLDVAVTVSIQDRIGDQGSEPGATSFQGKQQLNQRMEEQQTVSCRMSCENDHGKSALRRLFEGCNGGEDLMTCYGGEW